MAVTAGTVREAWDFTEAEGPQGATVKVMSCKVSVDFVGGETYEQDDNANFSPAALIAAERRNGKTPTILSASALAPGDNNGVITGAGPCTVSAGVVTFPLTTADLVTERAETAVNATWNKPIRFNITFSEAKD